MLEIFEVPKSEFVQKIAYDGFNIFVKIKATNHSSKYFRYDNLPRDIFEKFCNAPSKGTFLNKTLKKLRRGVPCLNLAF